MNPTHSALLLSMLTLASLAHAASKHPTDTVAAPVLMAVADVSVPILRPGAFDGGMAATSAGVAASLPDVPAAQQSLLRIALRHEVPQVVSAPIGPAALPDAPGVSTLLASPLADAARRLGSGRFNTEDGSSADDFAICYRLNSRASVQVIPGDPAPVKMPVTSMANNTGVTVGMVLRLSKPR